MERGNSKILLGTITLSLVLVAGCKTIVGTDTEAALEPPPPPEPIEIVVCGYGRPPVNYPLFGFDGTAIGDPQRQAIATLVPWLIKYPQDTVEIIGHTCDLGDANYNLELGLRLAQAVADEMVRMGVNAQQITTTTRGESDPLVPNDSEANRRLNRTVTYNVTIND